MKNYRLILLILVFTPFISFSQSTRSEVYNTLSQIFEITKNSSLVIETSNMKLHGSLISKGLAPLEIGVYRFRDEGSSAKLFTATETYYSPDRDLISMYSSEQNKKRQDYQPYIFSQVRTVTYGPVLKDSNGLYYTVTTSFNLE